MPKDILDKAISVVLDYLPFVLFLGPAVMLISCVLLYAAAKEWAGKVASKDAVRGLLLQLRPEGDPEDPPVIWFDSVVTTFRRMFVPAAILLLISVIPLLLVVPVLALGPGDTAKAISRGEIAVLLLGGLIYLVRKGKQGVKELMDSCVDPFWRWYLRKVFPPQAETTIERAGDRLAWGKRAHFGNHIRHQLDLLVADWEALERP